MRQTRKKVSDPRPAWYFFIFTGGKWRFLYCEKWRICLNNDTKSWFWNVLRLVKDTSTITETLFPWIRRITNKMEIHNYGKWCAAGKKFFRIDTLIQENHPFSGQFQVKNAPKTLGNRLEPPSKNLKNTKKNPLRGLSDLSTTRGGINTRNTIDPI